MFASCSDNNTESWKMIGKDREKKWGRNVQKMIVDRNRNLWKDLRSVKCYWVWYRAGDVVIFFNTRDILLIVAPEKREVIENEIYMQLDLSTFELSSQV